MFLQHNGFHATLTNNEQFFPMDVYDVFTSGVHMSLSTQRVKLKERIKIGKCKIGRNFEIY